MRITRTIVAMLTLAVLTAAPSQIAHADTHPMVGRDYPTHIEGHFKDGWTITWRDGNTTGLGTWRQLVNECHHDAHPVFCVSLWRQYEWDLGIMRAIIRDR